MYLNFLCYSFSSSEQNCFISFREMGEGWTDNVHKAPCTAQCGERRVGKESILDLWQWLLSVTGHILNHWVHFISKSGAQFLKNKLLYFLKFSRNITDFIVSLINTNSIHRGNKITFPHYMSSLYFTHTATTSIPTLIIPHLEGCNNFPTDLPPSCGSSHRLLLIILLKHSKVAKIELKSLSLHYLGN